MNRRALRVLAVGTILASCTGGTSDGGLAEPQPTGSAPAANATDVSYPARPATDQPATDPPAAPATDPPEPAPPPTDPLPGPSALGFDTAAIIAGLDALAAQDPNVHSIVATRGGVTALDVSLWPASGDDLQDVASLTKSVVALAVGAALQRGDLESLDMELGALLPLPDDSAVATTTLRQLLRMRSGLDCGLEGGEPRLAAMLASTDYVATAAAIPPSGTRGETFGYCSPGYHLVSAALAAATGRSLADYASQVLFAPLGIDRFEWPSDPQGITHGWGDLEIRPADLARLGRLVVDDGRWDGTRILPAGFVGEMAAGGPTGSEATDYGMGWWLAADTADGVLEGIGRGGQALLVAPADDLVVVVTGAATDGQLIARIVQDALAAVARPTPAGDADVAARVVALSSPPNPTAPTAPTLGLPFEVAFDLDPNPLGLERVTIAQRAAAETQVTLVAGGSLFVLPVGLDGVARVAPDAPTGRPVALTGSWIDGLLLVDEEEVAGPNHWSIELDPTDGFTMTVTDLTGEASPIAIRGAPAD